MKFGQNGTLPLINLAMAYGNVHNTNVRAIAKQIIGSLFSCFWRLWSFFFFANRQINNKGITNKDENISCR